MTSPVPPVIALSGFPAGALVWEAAPGQETLTVVAKATFTLAPGELALAPKQDPLCDETQGAVGVASSLRYAGDFAPSKRRVDVSLVGHAYAPGGDPVTSLVARLAVAELDKSLRVTGDRSWERPPTPFARMPLAYERAPHTPDNPVGVAPSHAPANLSIAGAGAGASTDHPDEAPCFGPIASTWPSRRRLLEEASTFWAHGVARDRRLGGPPPGPAPPRFDFAFFNAAPPDQQLDLLRPGATIELENLHPRHPHLVATLPKLRPQVFVLPALGEPGEAPKGRVEEIILRCDALWIDTDRAVAVLTWRGLMELRDGAAIRAVAVAADVGGRKLRFAQIERWLGDETNPTLRLTGQGGEGGSDEMEDPITNVDPLAERHDALKTQRLLAELAASRGGATEGAPPVEDEPTSRVAASAPPAVPWRAPAVPHPPGAPSPAGPPGRQTTVVIGEVKKPSPAGPASVPRPGLVLRPDLTLDRCAEIAGSLAQPAANRTAILRARLLTEASWSVAEKHWQRVVAAETERGETTTADAFDEAMVRAQEQRAVPIDLPTYARLSVAVERGFVGAVLTDLSLSLADLLRLHRVWERRAAASSELAAKLAAALDRARRG